MNEHHADHGHGNGEFNTRHIGQAQTDGVGTKTRKAHQHHSKSCAEEEGWKCVGCSVGEPHRPDESHDKKQQQHNGAIVNVADDDVVSGNGTAAL